MLFRTDSKMLPIKVLLSIGFIGCLGLQSGLLAAQTKTWNNGNGTSKWGEAGNWSPSGIPVAGDSVVFDGSTSNAGCDAETGTVAQNLAALTVLNSYTGTLTFKADFAGGSTQALTVSGDVQLDGGAGFKLICHGKIIDSLNGTGTTISASNIFIGSDALMHSDGLGFPLQQGPGGSTAYAGTHGGRGGESDVEPYGSATLPVTLGSGGNNSAGGGAIRLLASQKIDIDGILRTNGVNLGSNWQECGSGGSIFINCATLEGSGFIQSQGGKNTASGGRGGGGGRIAVDAATYSFLGTFDCKGGNGANTIRTGRPGTLVLPTGVNLTVTSGNKVGLAPGSWTLDVVIVEGNAELFFHGAWDPDSNTGTHDGIGATLSATSFELKSTGVVSANFDGYAKGQGPARGVAGWSGGSWRGGGHGGRGAGHHDLPYGSPIAPIDLGSGGTQAWGGGAIKIDVGVGSITINGNVITNGQGAQGITSSGGSGAGGSIHLICGTFSGSGLLQANGGSTGGDGYGGGGGRIAVDWSSSIFAGNYDCSFGTGSYGNGQTGTVSLTESSSLNLTVNAPYRVGLAPGSHTFGDVVVGDNTELFLHSNTDPDNTPSSNDGLGCTLNANSVNLAAAGKILASKDGYKPATGPGSGPTTGWRGGSYGGKGSATTGNPYDIPTAPTTLGSGGTQAFGGGFIKIDLGSGDLVLNGSIQTNGQNAKSTTGTGGGGSGGGISIICGALTGSGSLQAKGGSTGSGGTKSGHGGGGGRIALKYATSSFTGTLNVSGGIGVYGTGQDGSVTPGSLFVAVNDNGAATNLLTLGLNTDYTLYAFKFSTLGHAGNNNADDDETAFEDIQISQLVFDISKTGGVLPADVTNIQLFNGGTPITIKSSVLDIVGVVGILTLTFDPGDFVIGDASGAAMNLRLEADLANIQTGNKFPVMLNLDASKIAAAGTVLLAAVTPASPNVGFADLAAGTGGAPALVLHEIPGNSPPSAVDDAYTVLEDSILTINIANGVLANDGDADCDAITAQLLSAPANGTVNLAADGSFTYDPTANFVGTDTFTYQAKDTSTLSNVATVTIVVTTDNDAPVAFADSYQIENDQVLLVPAAGVLSNDTDVENDPLSAVLVSGPGSGTLTLNADGSFSYTPNAGFTGVDSFSYMANDAIFNSSAVTVTIQVFAALNGNPAATPAVIVSGESTTLSSNPTGGSGTVSSYSWTGPNGYNSSIQNPGALTFPDTGFYTYTLTVTDSLGFVDTTTVSVAVLGSALVPNPSASPDLLELGSTTILSSNPTGGSGVYVGYNWTGPNGYSSSLQNPGSVTPNTPGPHTYTLTVTDASGLVASSSVTVLVGLPFPGLLIGNGGAKYRVYNNSNSLTPRDNIRIVMRGIDLLPGDRIAARFHGVSIGDLSKGDGLTLDGKLRAKGQLGFAPNIFTKCSIRYMKRSRKLIFVAKKGSADRQGQPMVQATSGTSTPILVAILIDRAPADGIIDIAALVPVTMKVKVKSSGSGQVMETGRSMRKRR